VDYLPDSFTYPGSFPALIKLRLAECVKLVEFPEVHEGALPKLRKLDLRGCKSLGSLPLSLKFLTSLRELSVARCQNTLKDACRTNCKNSETWSKFDIQY